MTTATVSAAGMTRARAGDRSPLLVLAGVEARRFARHPLFLVAVGLTAIDAYQMHVDTYDNRDEGALELSLGQSVLIGLLGLVVAYRLTRSTRRADELVAGVPADEPTRTAALLLACLVPFAASSLASLHIVVSWHVEPITWAAGWSQFSSVERDAMMVAAALSGLGAPVLGVCLGRWWRWPGASLIACVGLVAWTILALVPWQSRWGNVSHMTAPFVLWASALEDESEHGYFGGSPTWRVAYVVALIGLAAVAALLHGATGPARARLLLVFAGLGAFAIATLLIAALPGPTLTYV
jgi:hypothetical protein